MSAAPRRLYDVVVYTLLALWMLAGGAAFWFNWNLGLVSIGGGAIIGLICSFLPTTETQKSRSRRP
jgi:hypothetical protein